MYPGGKKSLQPSSNITPLFERALFSSIYHCFKARGMMNTLSVFIAESGIENQSPLSELDVLQALQFGNRSSLYSAVKQKVESKCVNENAPSQEKSVLEMMITEGVSRMRNGSCDAICQTDQGQSVRDFLVEQNMELHNKYMAQLEEEKKAPVRSIEERMITFERECEERYRKDLEDQTAYIRDVEMKRIREEENNANRAEINRLRRDLENEYQQRIALYNQREEELTRTQLNREKAMEKSLYESRQHQLKEMEDIKMREAAAAKKFELESQGLKTLENRLSEAQASYEIREKELSRREKLVEEKSKDFLGKAKEEASKALSQELEALSRDRQSLKDERDRFEEEKKSQTELIAGSTDALAKVREMQKLLLQKEEEFLAAKQEVLLLQSYRNDDEAKVAEMLNVPVDSLIGPNTKDYLMKLMRHVSDMKQQSDENKAIRREMNDLSEKNRKLQAKEETHRREIDRLKISIKQVQGKFKSEMVKAENDINNVLDSKTELSVKLQNALKRCAELEALLENQRVVNNRVGKLQRINNKINASRGVASSSSSSSSSNIRPGDKFFSSEVDSLLYKTPSSPTRVRQRSSSPDKRHQSTGLSIADIQELIDRQVAAEISSKQAEAPQPPPAPAVPTTSTFPPIPFGYHPMGYPSMYMPPHQQQPTTESTENLTKAFADMMRQQREDFERKLNDAMQNASDVPQPTASNTNIAINVSDSAMSNTVSDSMRAECDPEKDSAMTKTIKNVAEKPTSPTARKSSTSAAPSNQKSPSQPLLPQAETTSSEETMVEIVTSDLSMTRTKENEEERLRKMEAEKAIAYNREQARLEEERIEVERKKREEEREAARKEQEELEKELKRKTEEEKEARKKLEEEEKARLEAEESERKRKEEERLAEAKKKEEEKNKGAIEAQKQLQAEKEKKDEEDKAAIKAAREKVLARRRKSITNASSDFKEDPNAETKIVSTQSASGSWTQARRSPKNGGDSSLNNTTYDDIQTGFESSPRGGNTSYDSGW